MMAGALTDKVEVYEPVKSTNNFGERVTEWQKCYTTRAEVVHTGGNRTNENGEIILTQYRIFRLRIYVPLTDYSRIKWEGNYYRITNLEKNQRLRMTTVTTEKVNE